MFDRPCQVMTLEGSYEDVGRQRAERVLRRKTPFTQRLHAAWLSGGDGATGGAAGHGGDARWRPLLRTLERYCPQLVDELDSFARGLGLEVRHILSGWAYPRGGGALRGGCTLFAVNVGEGAGDGAGPPLCGRNFDLRYEDMDRCLVLARPRGGPATIGCNGWIGLADGMNDGGLAVVTAEVYATRPATATGDAGHGPRLRVAEETLAARRGAWDVADCRELLARRGVAQGRITLWSEVFEPSRQRLHYAPGASDRNESRSFDVPGGPYELELPVNV